MLVSPTLYQQLTAERAVANTARNATQRKDLAGSFVSGTSF